ncbi:MAG: hypothetical protein AB1782_01845 [Cyanobacteriota bacterium]
MPKNFYADRTLSGTNIAQYAIVIAVVAAFIVPAFYNFSLNIQNNLIYTSSDHQSNGMDVKEKNIDLNETISILKEQNEELYIETTVLEESPGCYGGAPDRPVVHCVYGICSIDFGESIISNIPENYKEFAETTGYSF